MIHLSNENEVLDVAAKIRAERAYESQKNYGLAIGVGLGAGQCNTQTENPRRIGPSNEDIVSHHSPDLMQIQRITSIRAAARNFLDTIDANCVPCADTNAAKRKVREAMFTANAAIVLNGSV